MADTHEGAIWNPSDAPQGQSDADHGDLKRTTIPPTFSRASSAVAATAAWLVPRSLLAQESSAGELRDVDEQSSRSVQQIMRSTDGRGGGAVTGNAGGVSRATTKVLARPGDVLPAMILESTAGRQVDLAREATRTHLVLFFYPGDLEGLRYVELTGCTPEACAFRDSFSQLTNLGVQVFGVNFHTTSRQRSFVEREHLPFELLSDSEKALTTSLGIPIWRSVAGEEFVDRVTIIVQRGGAIRLVFDEVQVEGHITEVLDALSQL